MCVYTFGIQHAMSMRQIACALSGYAVFFHFMS